MLQSMAMNSSFAESLALTFLPLFIAIDALGTLPFIISASEGLGKKEQRKMANVAILTTTVVGLIFLFFGQFVLKLMGISVGSFAIGGGLILLSISIHHLLTGNIVDIKKRRWLLLSLSEHPFWPVRLPLQPFCSLFPVIPSTLFFFLLS